MSTFSDTGTFHFEPGQKTPKALLVELGAERRLRGLELLARGGHATHKVNEGVTVYVKWNECAACFGSLWRPSLTTHGEYVYFVETREPWQIEAVTRDEVLRVLGDPL